MSEPITTAVAAERLGVTIQRVRQYILDGRIQARKFGSVYMVDPESVAAFRPKPVGNPDFGPGYRRPSAKA